MDHRIKELIATTKARFGLTTYYLKRHGLHRDVTIFNETVYTLSMEWFPEHIEEPADGSNPEGTAVIEIHVPSEQLDSVIFVMGKTDAKNGINFTGLDTNAIIKWVEQETGLTCGRHFELHKKEEGRLLFKEVFNGTAVSPSGSIEIKWNEEGNLILFVVDGHFPSKERIKEEMYTLSFDKVEQVAKEELQLLEFPSFEQEKMIPVYGVEEVYLTNDQMTKVPFEFIVDAMSYLSINETIYFDQTITNRFERQEIIWTEEITADQAFSAEPSPDSHPITKQEQEMCLLAVKGFLHQEYPNDSGSWILKTLHRDEGYIHATLRANKEENHVFKRKLTVIIEPTSFRAVNSVDNKPMLDIFNEFQAPDQVTVTKEEAYNKLKELYDLTPYYVYDLERKQYILCGKIDCPYGVNANSGKVIALDDL